MFRSFWPGRLPSTNDTSVHVTSSIHRRPNARVSMKTWMATLPSEL
jgi:hypothetical protein